jgi:cysteine desulfurase
VAYLDAASTEPLHPSARETLLAAVDAGWADPARLYREARQAKLLLDRARESVAAGLGARPDEITFVASGTQALHVGMLGALQARRRVGRHLVVSAIEHSAVLHVAEGHERTGGDVSHVAVDVTGRVEPEAYAEALRNDSALACLQSANHEVGTLQPVLEVTALCRDRGVPLLVDAAQTVGRFAVEEGWSFLTASAHKWGGPAGVGILAVRRGVRWRTPGPADEREHGRAPGFENVPMILAAATALEARMAEAATLDTFQRPLVDLIRRRVPELVPDVQVVGHPTLRLPHLVTFSCLYVDGEALLHELDRRGFAVSSGSSCTSSSLRPSHVLEAMGVLSHGNIRVSLTRTTTDQDIHRFLEVLPVVVSRLRDTVGVGGL